MTVQDLPAKFKDLLTTSNRKKSRLLLWVQVTLLVFLVATFFLVLAVNESGRERLYCGLILGLIVLLFAAIGLNLYDKYEKSAFVTVIATVIGPWGSILLDPTIFHGDFVPLIYISLSIQLCAILLSVKPTIIIGAFQLSMLSVCILIHDELQHINWPSLLAFVVLTSGISIVASFLYRRQYSEISKQKEQLIKNEFQLREMAIRDSLTGLYNRRYMATSLEREIGRAARNQHSVGIIMIDIDNYKTINDNFGHVLGDYALFQIAQMFSKNLRSSDIICRYGGDEFVLVMPNSSLADTMKKAEELRQIAANNDLTFEGVAVRVTLSLGVSIYPEHGQTGDALLKAADKALYAAKKNGRNCAVAIPVE